MRVVFHKYFNKSYKKCPIDIQNKFKKKLKIFLENPNNSNLKNHSLVGEWSNFRSINITGDYRALYHFLDLEKNLVEFFIIDTHSNLYN